MVENLSFQVLEIIQNVQNLNFELLHDFMINLELIV